MFEGWHLTDIVETLKARGWGDWVELKPQSYEVGRAVILAKGNETLKLFILADVGTGYINDSSLESIVGLTSSGKRAELWLHRTRSGKWRSELIEWADRFLDAS